VTDKERDDASSDDSDSDESDLRNSLSARTRELDDLKFSHRKLREQLSTEERRIDGYKASHQQTEAHPGAGRGASETAQPEGDAVAASADLANPLQRGLTSKISELE
jgi:hypothetical protein